MTESKDFMFLIGSIKKKMYKILNEYIKKYGISLSEALYLDIISEKKGITMKEITEIVQCDKGMTSKVISSLKEKNLVMSNNRKIISTEYGNILVNKISKLFNQIRDNILSKVNSEDVKLLYDLLIRFNNVLEGEIKC